MSPSRRNDFLFLIFAGIVLLAIGDFVWRGLHGRWDPSTVMAMIPLVIIASAARTSRGRSEQK